jgi:hypothetical protein
LFIRRITVIVGVKMGQEVYIGVKSHTDAMNKKNRQPSSTMTVPEARLRESSTMLEVQQLPVSNKDFLKGHTLIKLGLAYNLM